MNSVLHSITVPPLPLLQKKLHEYQKTASKLDEVKRFSLAQDLYKSWPKDYKTMFPGIPSRNDYWYIAQLLALKRHITVKNKAYKFLFDKQIQCYVDSLLINGINQEQTLFNLLLQTNKKFVNHPLTRKELDFLIDQSGKKVLKQLQLDTTKWTLQLMPYDLLLRSSLSIHPSIRNIFFEGYRLRTDGEKTALFGGNTYFGGNAFIDSIWMDSKNKSIFPGLVILPIGIYE